MAILKFFYFYFLFFTAKFKSRCRRCNHYRWKGSGNGLSDRKFGQWTWHWHRAGRILGDWLWETSHWSYRIENFCGKFCDDSVHLLLLILLIVVVSQNCHQIISDHLVGFSFLLRFMVGHFFNVLLPNSRILNLVLNAIRPYLINPI